jgi:hypothetical protein
MCRWGQGCVSVIESFLACAEAWVPQPAPGKKKMGESSVRNKLFTWPQNIFNKLLSNCKTICSDFIVGETGSHYYYCKKHLPVAPVMTGQRQHNVLYDWFCPDLADLKQWTVQTENKWLVIIWKFNDIKDKSQESFPDSRSLKRHSNKIECVL